MARRSSFGATTTGAELAATGRSNETGPPYGAGKWVDRLFRQMKLDLTIRLRGRPRKEDANDKEF